MGGIDGVLIRGDGSLRRGGAELVGEWREDPASHLWIDLHDVPEEQEEPLLVAFGLHPLAIRDARRQRHPPKIELFEDHLFILLSELDGHSPELDFAVVQLALFAGPRFLLTRHNAPSASCAQWLLSAEMPATLGGGGIRLALEIAISAARRYVDMLLEFEPRLTELEDQLQDRPDDGAMRELTQYRTRLRKLRRVFNYHARAIESLRGVKVEFFNATSHDNRHLVLDVYEKYERLLSLSTLYYELAGDLVDGYISLSSHELNRTMRILTVLTAIFVPLSFLAGLYGMNFEYMPELGWRWGYFILLGVMGSVILVLLAVFRRNRWL
ncbi:MAG: magnesium transporter CorA family protein [Porticoccaceae bacterium]|nr:magnesium transporter CorA family protein [Porticoccaceae bacterium]MEA3299202.1 magnesium transporter CorA family protein [Pseudomonadota bacterium]